MLYLLSQQASPPDPEPIRNPPQYQTLPPGVVIPESWHDAYAEEREILPQWTPRFLDSPDVEERLGKDIEDFSCDELERYRQTEDFGRHIDVEGNQHIIDNS